MGVAATDEADLRAAEVHSSNWVAVVPLDDGSDQVVGIVGVVGSGAVPQMPPDMALAREWRRRDDVAEIIRLSVDPELWRRGVGTRLIQAAVQWCRGQGFRTIVINTTPPQVPALNLYRKLGFREASRSFSDKYELVWLELTL